MQTFVTNTPLVLFTNYSSSNTAEQHSHEVKQLSFNVFSFFHCLAHCLYFTSCQSSCFPPSCDQSVHWCTAPDILYNHPTSRWGPAPQPNFHVLSLFVLVLLLMACCRLVALCIYTLAWSWVFAFPCSRISQFSLTGAPLKCSMSFLLYCLYFFCSLCFFVLALTPVPSQVNWFGLNQSDCPC